MSALRSALRRTAMGWLLLAAMVGCRGEKITDVDVLPKGGSGGSELTGKIEIDGSSTVFPITEGVADAFNKQHPGVRPTVAQSGTGGGFKRFTRGETDVSNASRPIKKSEADACKSEQVQFIELPVAYDGLTFVVHNENTWVEQLTVDQLKTIFRADKAAKTWKEVDPSWPDQPINLYIPGTDSGTFDYFKEVIVGSDKQAAIRGDDRVSTSEDDETLVTGVSRDKSSLGFFGVAYFEENRDKLKALKIVNPDTGVAVAPTTRAIETGEYAPFGRPLFVYINRASLKRPEVKSFAEFYLAHAAEFSAKVGYVPLPDAIYASARRCLQAQRVGTQFLDAKGEARKGALSEIYTEAGAISE